MVVKVIRIGITGGTGAGKTSALNALERLGALVLDCDAVYHELLAGNRQMKAEINKRFPGVLKDGRIDRAVLGAAVFADKDALLALNEITHKYVISETERRTREWAERGGKITAYDAIALIESGMAERCDIVVGITAPAELRLKRIMLRDGISAENAQKRIDAQKPDSFFYENCGYILENVYNNPEEFEQRCVEFFDRILNDMSQ